MSSTRQLAAIMFTDIVGYTALMGEDEQKAFAVLRKNRQLHKPIIERYNGTWIKEMGDGILASFHTVTDSVLCATTIQQACARSSDLRLRIGIHLGEVVFENKDVFGDGVNIASRLQALAPIGEILVSEAIYINIKNQPGFETEFFGDETLKNVAAPVKIYRVKAANDSVTQLPVNPYPQNVHGNEKSLTIER
jgi:adenylate cyclase